MQIKSFQSKIIFALFLFIVCTIIYFPNPNAGFVLDAHYVIGSNPHIKNLASVTKIFQKGLFDSYHSPNGESHLSYYRPVLALSYIVDYAIWGLNAYGYRWANLFFHFINSLLVLWFVYSLTDNKKISYLSALFFCILPVHEFCVNNIVGRGDILQTLFALLSMILFVKYLKHGKNKHILLSLLMYILSFLSREVGILLPVTLCVIGLLFPPVNKKRLSVIFFYLLIGSTYYSARVIFAPIVSSADLNVISLHSVVTFLKNFLEYNFRFLIPWSNLSGFPDFAKNIIVYGAGIGVFLSFGLWVKLNNKNSIKNIFFFSSLFCIVNSFMFFIVEGLIIYNGPYQSEHLLYFSSIGFSILLSELLVNINSKQIKVFLTIALFIYYSSTAYVNNAFWINEYSVLKRVQKTEWPQITVITKQLLMMYEDDEKIINKIIKNSKSNAQKSIWFRRLGMLARSKGNYDLAIENFQKSIQLNPLNTKTNIVLAVCYLETNQVDRGQKILLKSIETCPDHPEASRLLGISYFYENKFNKSIEYLRKTVFINPDDYDAHYFLATSYYQSNQKQLAMEQLKFLKRKWPENPKNNQLSVLWKQP